LIRSVVARISSSAARSSELRRSSASMTARPSPASSPSA
jgi:hypothetical protein